MFEYIQRIFSKGKRREHRVVKALNKAKSCIVQKDLQCVLEHLNEAIRHDDCTICREEIQVFKKQVKRLSSKQRLKKVDLLLKISRPAAYIVPRMRQIRMIKPKQKQATRQRTRSKAR